VLAGPATGLVCDRRLSRSGAKPGTSTQTGSPPTSATSSGPSARSNGRGSCPSFHTNPPVTETSRQGVPRVYLVGSPFDRTRRRSLASAGTTIWLHASSNPENGLSASRRGPNSPRRKEGGWRCQTRTVNGRLVSLIEILGIAACDLLGAGVRTVSTGTRRWRIGYIKHRAHDQCTKGTNQNGAWCQVVGAPTT
jgi:hypothetical protein